VFRLHLAGADFQRFDSRVHTLLRQLTRMREIMPEPDDLGITIDNPKTIGCFARNEETAIIRT
jgi:hypothetical protein